MTPLESRAKLAAIVADVIKTLAVVIGGAWIAFRYFTIERDTEHQRLEQLRLANQQATLTLRTQQESQRLELEQQRLANDTARFTLAVQESQRQLQQQELETSVVLHRLEARRARLDVGYKECGRHAARFLIDSRRDGEGNRYVINHGFEIVNTSERPLVVSAMAIDYFLGTPREDNSSEIAPIGCPANRWNEDSAQKGRMEWKPIGCMASITESAFARMGPAIKKAFHDCQLVRGGPGTGPLQPSQPLEYTDTYTVTAPPDAYVLFVTSYCLDRCKTEKDLVTMTKWVALRDGTTDRTFSTVAAK